MAIAFGASTTGSSSFNSPNVSGSDTYGVVFHEGDSADNNSGITWNGVSMSKVASINFTGDRYVGLWIIAAPAAGVTTIASTGGTTKDMAATYYTGVKQTGQPDSSATFSQNLTITAIGTTTVVATGCWLVWGFNQNLANNTYTYDVGVQRAANGDFKYADSDGTVGTGSQSITATGTTVQAHWGVMASLAPAPAANTGGFFMAASR